jgi:hypothetical protein
MSGPLKPVLDILAALGELEWARCVGGTYPPDRSGGYGGASRPPLLAWRFKAPDRQLEQRIVAAVESYSGSVDWSVTTNGRNWSIVPVVFDRYAADFRVDVEAMQQFGQDFPTETKAANDDAARLAEHLEKELTHAPITADPVAKPIQ